MIHNISVSADICLNDMLLPTELPMYRGRILMAGPCSAESNTQTMEVAEALAHNLPGTIFRAGVWKPRTAPGSFEGRGEPALEWLADVKRCTGMPVATEVALPEHVKSAARAGIDILWIGARTAANPFAIQSLADTIADLCPNTPVFVKNPVSPDLELWIGAIARLLKAGVRKLGAIHRGFSVYQSAPFRNAPLWQIPMELHRRIPSLPIIHDPSHTAGCRDLLHSLSQKALDMGFSGLMIETHPAPQAALSDSAQQITPNALIKLINLLKVRTASTSDQELEQLRSQIDELDNELLNILARRMNVSRTIGEYKKRNDMPVMQKERYNRLLTALLEKGCEQGLNPKFLTKLLELIHAESVNTQLSIINPE